MILNLELTYFLIFLLLYNCTSRIQTNLNTEITNFEFISKVCIETVKVSDLPFLHIINLRPDFSTAQLVQIMHHNFVSTILVDHQHNLELTVSRDRLKNMLFLMNDCQDILNLLLSFSAQGKTEQRSRARKSIERYLPNYCVRYPDDQWSYSYDDITFCDFNLSITYHELNPDSVLSGELYNQTRGLYSNHIFNGDNFLIFYMPMNGPPNLREQTNLKSFQENGPFKQADFSKEINGCRLFVIFKFIWRIFHGIRTVLCFSEIVCYWYDPFLERIIEYTGKSQNYFNFSWSSMNKKNLSAALFPSVDSFDTYFGSTLWEGFFATNSYWNFYDYLNSSTKMSVPITMDRTEWLQDSSKGLQENFDLILFEEGVRIPNSSQFDFSPAIETTFISFISPQRGFVPQYLVIFKSFQPTVWIMVSLTYIVCLLVHHSYKNLTMNVFKFHFDMKDLESYGNISTLWSIYSYFLCVAQERLIFKRLWGGKMFFMTLTFSTLVLSTVFQSSMVTLIARGSRNKDIDTFKELEESDLLIQSSDKKRDQELLRDFNYDASGRMQENFHHILNTLMTKVQSEETNIYGKSGSLHECSKTFKDSEATFESYTKVFDRILTTNSFIISFLPLTLTKVPKNIIFHFSLIDKSYKFHCGQQYVSLPLVFAYRKYSIFAERFNDYLLRVTETGITKREQIFFFSTNVNRSMFFDEEDYSEDPRPFTVSDMMIAFLVLAIGSSFSSLLFVVELLEDNFEVAQPMLLW